MDYAHYLVYYIFCANTGCGKSTFMRRMMSIFGADPKPIAGMVFFILNTFKLIQKSICLYIRKGNYLQFVYTLVRLTIFNQCIFSKSDYLQSIR